MIPEIQEEGLAYSHLYYNLGNLFLARKDHFCALSYYQESIKCSPYRLLKDFKDYDDASIKPKPRLNSQSCYANAFSNLAVIYLLISTNKIEIHADYERST
jgi:tetratricopeptide (TPR) repeat protein